MKMLIDGSWTDASNGAAIQVLNSATQEPIDTVPQATEADVKRAIRAAQAGKAAWAATPTSSPCPICTSSSGISWPR